MDRGGRLDGGLTHQETIRTVMRIEGTFGQSRFLNAPIFSAAVRAFGRKVQSVSFTEVILKAAFNIAPAIGANDSAGQRTFWCHSANRIAFLLVCPSRRESSRESVPDQRATDGRAEYPPLIWWLA